MTIRLRPHHLLCVLTYVGKGYSPAFTANFDAIAARLARGEPAVIVAGPDDVCAPLLGEAGAHCHRDSVSERDRRAARDAATLLGRPVETQTRLVFDAPLLARLRTAFAAGAIRSACGGCQWQALCSDIAAGGYRDVRVGAG